eukprot:CAMPEP_0116852350 /NCGR_PEP_ID=MMETSP0418-20121206/17243_1 /TAXON_ID=1158023 /ORGANISM="Astrosyne radiata, Strain 13vi08-1A" /LENGTH=242 /DNA_ID=CAMNT_0004484501 /DNA_START=37 /DNA_END=765 /DNA_ORIENTATION=-
MSMKTVLITGGNRGLGKGLVDTFAKAGWKVLATARRVDSIASQDNVQAYPLDLSVQSQIDDLVEKLVQEKQAVDVVIHNAGFNPKDAKDKPEGYFDSTFYVKDFSAENVSESLRINALHPMELTGKLLSKGILTTDGIVIGISSWLGSITKKNFGGHYGYAGSKALFNMCIKGMSIEFQKDEEHNRTAVAINPGWMRTDMGGPKAETTPEQVAERILNMIQDGFLAEHNGRFLNTDRTEHEW